MFNLFSKKTEQPSKEVLVAEKPKYPKVVEDIHNEFNIAGENLLREAKDIIASIRIDNEGKVDALKSLGFLNTKEVIQTEVQRQNKVEKEAIANALEYFSQNYPKYKFITMQMANKICEKYNLVMGDVSQYTGFVPQKNLTQIEDFFKIENELNVIYYKRYLMPFSSSDKRMSKDAYDEENEHRKLMSDLDPKISSMYNTHSYIGKKNNELKIAATLKDMKSEGHSLNDRIFTKEVPDPVILAPVWYKETELLCIVTAWGDEASDPIVVNEINN
jgi:hypothetical protein